MGIDHWSATGVQSGRVKASNLCGRTSGRCMSSSSTLMNVKVLQMFLQLWNTFSLDSLRVLQQSGRKERLTLLTSSTSCHVNAVTGVQMLSSGLTGENLQSDLKTLFRIRINLIRPVGPPSHLTRL